jgi:hypothetical protein
MFITHYAAYNQYSEKLNFVVWQHDAIISKEGFSHDFGLHFIRSNLPSYRFKIRSL